MISKFIFISVFLTLFISFGCTDTSQRSVGLSELAGLKIQDLAPAAAPVRFPKITFDVVAFEAPAEKVDSIKTASKAFSVKQINYADQSAFERNGLFAVGGLAGQGSLLTNRLSSIGAKRSCRTVIILFDQRPQLLPSEPFAFERYLIYTENDGVEHTIIMPPGQMFWQLDAAVDTFVSGLVHVRLVPVFNTLSGTDIKGLAGMAETPTQTFSHQRIDIDMRQGDFILLAPARQDKRTTLESLLFNPTGDKANVRLYVVVCTKAEG